MPTSIEDQILGWLSRRRLTASEIRQRLAKEGVPATEAEALLARLQGLAYVNDADLAEAVARDAIRRLKGPGYIWARLRQRGVSEAVISEVMKNLDGQVDWLAIAERLRRRYDRGNASSRARWLRHLAREGFPLAVIHRLAEDVGQRSDEDGVKDC
ncbi:MAG: RecX family transcriptional regulator [Firmicutes bacterium]|nr:RecX family transcriptional regulator [Bacillota bacterium]